MFPKYFWFGTTIPDFLFEGFDIKTPTGFVAICFGLASLAFLLERIKLYQKYSRCKIVIREAINSENNNPEETVTVLPSDAPNHTSCVVSYDGHGHHDTTRVMHRDECNFNPAKPRPPEHLMNTAYFTLVETLNYALMLCVMLYNGFFVISVILGSAVGYFLFGQRAYELTVIASCFEKAGRKNLTTAEQQRSERLSTVARDMLNVVSNTTNTMPSADAPDEHCHHEEENCTQPLALIHTVNV